MITFIIPFFLEVRSNMKAEEIRGLVVSKRKHRERDFLVKILTDKYGLKMFFVRGSKKHAGKWAQAIQPFTIATYIADVREEGLSFLNDVKDITFFKNLQTDIFLNAYANYLVQLTDAALEDGKQDFALFESLSAGLTAIDEGADPEIITNIFEVKFLRYFGVMPELRGCVVCGVTEGVFDYSSLYAGLLCQNDFDKDPRRYHALPKTISLLRLFSVLPLERLGNIEVKQETKKDMRMVIDKWYEENVGINLKSKKFIDNMYSWSDVLIDSRMNPPSDAHQKQDSEEKNS